MDRETVRSYRIIGGTVTWPVSLDQSLGCGPGVAVVYMTLSRGSTFTGCLDDTHLDPFQSPSCFRLGSGVRCNDPLQPRSEQMGASGWERSIDLGLIKTALSH